MKALGDAVTNENLAGWQQLTDPILKCVTVALNTPARRTDLPYGLRLLVAFAARDAALDQRLEKENIWSSVLKSNAVIFSEPLTARYTPRDWEALAALLGAVMHLHPTRALGADDAFFAAITRTLIHSERSVRSAAIRAVPSTSAPLSALLVAAFEKQLTQLPSPAPLRSVVAAALQCVGRGLFAATDHQQHAQAQAQFFVLAHHPAVVSNSLQPMQGATRALAHAQGVCDYLFSQTVLQNTAPHMHLAVVSAAATFVRRLPNGATLLAAKSVQVLREKEALEVSADDMGVLTTPEGTPYGKPQLPEECAFSLFPPSPFFVRD